MLLRLVNRLSLLSSVTASPPSAIAKEDEEGIHGRDSLNTLGYADDRAYYRHINDPENAEGLGTPLALAVASGRADIVRLLLSVEGIDVDLMGPRGAGGITPLFAACVGRQWAIAEMLVSAGADPCLGGLKNATSPLTLVLSSEAPALMLSFLKRMCGGDEERRGVYLALRRVSLLQCI